MLRINSQDLFFAKVKEDAIIPSKRLEDAGYDIYANFKEDYIKIASHETKLIPSGIATRFSSDYVAIIKERGSTGTKGIGQRCGIIDSNFSGEWFIPITNHNEVDLYIAKDSANFLDGIKDNAIIYPYSKAIAQFIMVQVPVLIEQELSLEQLQSLPTNRGTGALGSSGK